MYKQLIQFYWNTSHSHIRDPVHQPITKIYLYFFNKLLLIWGLYEIDNTDLVGSEGSAVGTYA